MEIEPYSQIYLAKNSNSSNAQEEKESAQQVASNSNVKSPDMIGNSQDTGYSEPTITDSQLTNMDTVMTESQPLFDSQLSESITAQYDDNSSLPSSSITAIIEEKSSINRIDEIIDSETQQSMKSTEETVTVIDDDLEDGEIETDDEVDDDDDDEPVITAIIPPPPISSRTHDKIGKRNSLFNPKMSLTINATKSTLISTTSNDEITTKLTSATASPSSKKSKFRRPDVVDDDFIGNIEHAIAAALKKDGIEPPIPKFAKRSGDDGSIMERNSGGLGQDSSVDDIRRNRKRKKRDEREKNKKRLKHRNETIDTTKMCQDEEFDEDEMLCVRGGSPQPLIHRGGGGASVASITAAGGTIIARSPSLTRGGGGFYDESDDSYNSSYDSYDSAAERKMSHEDRRQSRRNKDRRYRGSGGGGGGRGGSKRHNRHDSDGGDDCPRSHDARAPRKLELCKFYLMDCCAKKEKCSYMHGDFPCKYYYLGMECVYKGECKFSHGKPLTEQLKNILLKHIETAPKEILGNFRRISREHATNLLLTIHAKLCNEFGIENTMEIPAAGQSTSSSLSFNQQRQQRHVSPSETRTISSGNPFSTGGNFDESARKDSNKFSGGNDKSRKSRWCDHAISAQSNSQQQQQQQNALSPQPSVSQSTKSSSGLQSKSEILNLKNLKGVITPEQIDKLAAIGIENLEQISQLTVAQLNNVGLTISQINEIQLNAMNIQKLGLIGNSTTTTANSLASIPTTASSLSSSTVNSTSLLPSTGAITASFNIDDNSQSVQDVDMRFLVGAVQASTTPHEQSTVSSSLTNNQLTPILSTTITTTSQTVASSSNSSSNCTITTGQQQKQQDNNENADNETNSSTMDFSQYLKDSNIKDTDLLRDKDDDDALNEDEPELQIDESRCENSDDEIIANRRARTNSENSQSDFGIESIPIVPVFTTKGEDDDNWDDEDDTGTETTVIQQQSSPINKNDSDIRENDYRTNSWTQQSDSWNTKKNSKRWQNQDMDNNQWNDNDQKDRNDWSSASKPINIAAQTYYDAWNPDSGNSWTGSADQNYRSDPRNNCSGYTTTYSGDMDPFYGRGMNSSTNSSGNSGGQQYRDPRLGGGGGGGSGGGSGNSCNSNTSIFNSNFNDKQNIPTTTLDEEDWDADEPKINCGSVSFQASQDVIPPVIKEPSPPPKYQRSSIYDGTPKKINDAENDDDRNDNDDDNSRDDREEFGGDRDMRLSSFLDSGDIDLRLPFKPVMTNYTPATEIDGSISLHAPIPYKVYEIQIPKPDYSEIRRSMTVTEKTLDPRLRRIFCLKEPITEQYSSDSEMLRSPPHTTTTLSSSSSSSITTNKSSITENLDKIISAMSGPRIDPRRRKDIDCGAISTALLCAKSPTGNNTPGSIGSGLGQNVDIRLLLQKSNWYKNLNSKFKIMVNQQLALVSTELKKFHQDPNPDKVLDMKFLATNQNLQQVLTNLGIFIDSNGQIRKPDTDSDDTMMMDISGGGGGGMNNMGVTGPGTMMSPGIMMNVAGMPVMDFMRQPEMGMNTARFMNTAATMNNFVGGQQRFGGEIRPGLLGVAPGIEMFGSNNGPGSGQFGNSTGYDDYGGGGGGSGGNDLQSSGNPFADSTGVDSGKFFGRHNDGGAAERNNRGNRNFRQGGSRGGSHDRWSSGGGGNGNQGRNNSGRNRHHDGRGGGGAGNRDGRREKQK